MKIKFLHLTDLHFNPLNRIPQSRTADFHDQIASKWFFITNLMKNDEDMVGGLISGDIFHLKNPHYYIPEYLLYYSDMFELTGGMPWYTIPGNHDLPRSSYDLIKKAPYTLLAKATSNIHDVSMRTLLVHNDPPIHVSGVPFFPLEKTLEVLPQIDKHIATFKGFNILLLHADAMPDGEIELFWDTVGYDRVLQDLPHVDMICLGHIHASFPVHQAINPTTGRPQLISKPWSFSRVAKDYFNKTEILEHLHKPSYSLITFDIEEGKFNVEVTYHEIPCTPFNGAFQAESLAKQVETSGKLASFIEMLQKEHGSAGAGLQLSNPDDYMKEADIPQEVKEIIFEYLGES